MHKLDNATTSRQGALLQSLQEDGRLILGNRHVIIGAVELEQLGLAMLPKEILREKHTWV